MITARIGIVGRGNVATHLHNAISASLPEAEIELINPHELDINPDDFDILLISVIDSAIEEVSARIPVSDTIIAHTSGSIGMEILERTHKNCGVFYPLQTFTKGVALNYTEIPFFIEGSSEAVTARLKQLAGHISEKVYDAGSDKRRRLHLASVFACNFVNHLYARAWEILEDAGLPPEALTPLIEETAAKTRRTDPRHGQTGPAARGDFNVIEKHIAMLADRPESQTEYRLLSQGILNRRK